MPTIRPSGFRDPCAFTSTDSVRSHRWSPSSGVIRLLQVRVFCLGFFQDGDVGISFLPEGEEVLICSLCLCCVALQSVGATKLQTSESANGSVQYDSAMVENFLKLSRGFFALARGQVGFSANIDRIQGRPAVTAVSRPSQLIWQGNSESL